MVKVNMCVEIKNGNLLQFGLNVMFDKKTKVEESNQLILDGVTVVLSVKHIFPMFVEDMQQLADVWFPIHTLAQDHKKQCGHCLDSQIFHSLDEGLAATQVLLEHSPQFNTHVCAVDLIFEKNWVFRSQEELLAQFGRFLSGA